MKTDHWFVFMPLFYLFDFRLLTLSLGLLEAFRSKNRCLIPPASVWSAGLPAGAAGPGRAGVAKPFTNMPRFYNFCIFRKMLPSGDTILGLPENPGKGLANQGGRQEKFPDGNP